MKDFIHGQLIKAADSSAVTSMMTGAGVGAAANVGLGAVQGDFDIIGNAFSGAALGTAGGAGMKYMGNKYQAGREVAESMGLATDRFKFSMFSQAEKGHGFWEEASERTAKGMADASKEAKKRHGKDLAADLKYDASKATSNKDFTDLENREVKLSTNADHSTAYKEAMDIRNKEIQKEADVFGADPKAKAGFWGDVLSRRGKSAIPADKTDPNYATILAASKQAEHDPYDIYQQMKSISGYTPRPPAPTTP